MLRKFSPILLTFFFLGVWLSNCGSDQSTTKEPASLDLSGEALAKIHCASCHQYPAPGELDKQAWQTGVLPQMAYRFGIYPHAERSSLIEKGIGGQLVEQSNIYPQQATLALEDYEKIVAYYIENAPENLSLPAPQQLPQTALFKRVEVIERFSPPMGTMIKSFPDKNTIIYADAKEDYSSIEILDNDFRLIQRLAVPKPISDIYFSGDTLVATSMGQFTPSDSPSGSISKIFKQNGSATYSGFYPALKNLQRPLFTVPADLNQDGLQDLLICEYGNHTGQLAWYQNTGNRTYERHPLLAQAGALKAIVQDFNQDKQPDIMTLMAQGDEGIDLYLNQGNGQFSRQRVLRFSPLYGSVNFYLEDINKDGHLDIIYLNGDNADYSIIDKPYHGVHIYLNDGQNQFTEQFFYPFCGAYDAGLNDFDQDGDLDMAVISFFPRDNDPANGFVYLENTTTLPNELSFRPFAIPGTEVGRWIKLDVNDLNGDGKGDITLLSFTGMPLGNDPQKQYESWLASSPSILHLQNGQK